MRFCFFCTASCCLSLSKRIFSEALRPTKSGAAATAKGSAEMPKHFGASSSTSLSSVDFWLSSFAFKDGTGPSFLRFSSAMAKCLKASRGSQTPRA